MSSPPHGERPCDGYGLQGVSQEIGLAGVKLAPLTGAHDLTGVSDHGGPIEALAERVSHEGARCRMVATYARVDVSNEFSAVGDGDAPLQDSGHGALVQLIVDHGERLSFSGDAPGLGPIRGEFPLIDLGKVLGPPLLRSGGRLCFDGLGFACAVPLEQGEHERLVRGVLVHGFRTRWTRSREPPRVPP
jgi:hypothetical protein